MSQDKKTGKNMGRPKLESPKDIDLKVRLDKATNEELLRYCDRHGLKRAAAIREGVRLLLAEEDK